MAYENMTAKEVTKQTALDSMLGQANSLETIASDLLKRLKHMENRIHGNRPTAIGDQAQIPKAVPSGLCGQLVETLNSTHSILTDCHSMLGSLEEFA